MGDEDVGLQTDMVMIIITLERCVGSTIDNNHPLISASNCLNAGGTTRIAEMLLL